MHVRQAKGILRRKVKKMVEFYDLIDDYVDDCLLDENITSAKTFISITSLGNIPYIRYPGFSKDNNLEVLEAAREVLYKARTENKSNGTAMTYKLDRYREENDYALVFGDGTGVRFMSDPKTKGMAETANGLAIIKLHDHPGGSGFSFNDMGIFLMTGNIRLMTALNNKGEISALFRCRQTDYNRLLSDAIRRYVPDIKEKRKQGMEIKDIIRGETEKNVIDEISRHANEYGFIQTGWITRDDADAVSSRMRKQYENIASGKTQISG